MTDGFGIYKKKIHEEYINSWILINAGGNHFVGVLNDIEGGWAYFLPYHVVKHDGFYQKEVIVEDGLPMKIRIADIIGIVPTSRETTQNHIEHQNRVYRDNEIERQIKMKKLFPEKKLVIVSK